MFRRDMPLAVVVVGAFSALLLVYSPWAQWDGGWVFGPRFLVPVTPLLAIPAATFFTEHRSSTVIRAGTFIVLGISAAIAFESVQINFVDYHFAMWKSVPDVEHAMRWSWDWAPITRYWDFPVRDFIILPRLLAGMGGTALAVLAWSLVAAWIASAACLLTGFLRGRDRA